MTTGAYMMMPAGVKHVSAAAPGEDSIESISQDGKFDFALALRIARPISRSPRPAGSRRPAAAP